MRILIVSRALPHHHIGGMESVAWDLARAFAARGDQVRVLTTAHPSLPAEGEVEGIAVLTVPAAPGRYSPAWWRGSRERFAALAAAGEVDAVLGVSAAANAIAAARPPGWRGAMLFQAHGTSSGEIVSKLRTRSLKGVVGCYRNLYWGLFKDWIYRRYDAVVSVGEAVHRQMAKPPTAILLGATPERLIPNGVDEGAFAFDAVAGAGTRARYGLDGQARVLLSLSRLHAQKGVGDAIAAFALAASQAPDLRLLVAGDGPHAEALKAQAAETGLGDRIVFTGAVTRSEVPALLSAADAFVFPTRRVEGAPINVLEALAAGLPLITTPNGAAADLPAVRVPVGDAGALAAAMLETAPSPQPRAGRLPEGYSIRRTADCYAELFQDLISKRVEVDLR